MSQLGIHGPTEGFESVLSPAAQAFVGDLTRRFRPRIAELLKMRLDRQQRFDRGERPEFVADTQTIRDGAWSVAPIPDDLLDRRVEITGPIDAKMIINALNSGANVFMADFEDATAPTWRNQMSGQMHLAAAVRRTLAFHDKTRGKDYTLDSDRRLATLFVRPRGLHLVERHLTWQGDPVPGSLCDFGLFFFHNAAELRARRSGPYFYLPKLENRLEAQLWNDIFIFSQSALGIPHGSVRATVLIETLPAAFEMDEILYELRDHSAGLNCGRWDYIFSFIKTFRSHPDYVLPDRAQVGMTQPFMAAYSKRVIATCHRRGIHAMGGMAAQIPIKNDPAAHETAMANVRADKQREAERGHDGTWVAHPGLIPIAREAFDQFLTGPHQIDRQIDARDISAEDLIEVPQGPRTRAGLGTNIRVGIRYLESWLSGTGCVPLYHLMEDAATAEISRAQVWQWLHHKVTLDDGAVVDRACFETTLAEQLQVIEQEVGVSAFAQGRFDVARSLFADICLAERLENFLTIPAYAHL